MLRRPTLSWPTTSRRTVRKIQRSSLVCTRRLALCAVLAFGAACGLELEQCRDQSEQAAEEAPDTLRTTGLYASTDSEELADGVRQFVPQFKLWTDGADKRRFIALPADGMIDTSDPDDWIFPVGTKVWKEFSRDGVRIETRLLMKLENEQWVSAAYHWREDQLDADLAEDGVQNASGTAHDVPAAKDCAACHSGGRDFVLGFSAVQLAHDGAGFGLDELASGGRLSHPLSTADLQVPGDARARKALGTLHANCGHCHNALRNGRSSTECFTPAEEFELKLHVDELDRVESTATYRTTVNKFAAPFSGSFRLIQPGKPNRSLIHRRMVQRGDSSQMPPLATEDVDREGLAAVDEWIRSL